MDFRSGCSSVLAMLATLAAWAALVPAPALAAPSAAEIVSIEGKGEYRPEGEARWEPAKPRQPVAAGTYLRTLDLSRMAILFADNTQHQMHPNSTLFVKAIGGPDTPTVLNLNKGKTWTRSKDPPKGLKMETPSAVAAIRGTDWEMEVDDDGRATLSVFSGEVELSNDLGSVTIGEHEQGRAEKGRAPVKLSIVVSRDRIQWVSSFSVDPARLKGEDLPQAYGRLKRAATRGAEDELLLGDIETYRGELAAAREAFARGNQRFPGDERFEVALARVDLFSGDTAGARRHAQAAIARRPDSAEAQSMLGEVERRDGRAPEALAAFGKAIAAAAKDPRGWHGVGVVEGERENVRRARSSLERAIALDPREVDSLGELGTLEGVAGRLDLARETLMKALAIQSDNYVALTGLGVVELKAGRLEAALDALLRATLIEPRYARAHVYLAATYYQMRRDAAAIDSLKRASENDPNDPLPHLLRSMIHLDQLDPVAATVEAQAALDRLPFVKSLNAVADNQKGVANVGYPLAFMGLEAWSRSAAHDSYLPFWGSSHFFLADRYPGEFAKRSELSQGFLTNPIAFGASNRFQTLFPEPGTHGTVGLHVGRSDDLDIVEPVLTLNGYGAGPMPFAYFVEAIHTSTEPRNADVKLTGPTYTVAFGAKPTHELGVFLYANRLELDADLGRENESGTFDRIWAGSTRVEGGARYAFDATNSLWVKGGGSRENARATETGRLVLPGVEIQQVQDFTLRPSATDAAVRQTLLLNHGIEASWGLEGARLYTPRTLYADASVHLPGSTVPRNVVDQTDRDRSASAWVVGRFGDARLSLEAGLSADRYEKQRDIEVTYLGQLTRAREDYDRSKANPLAGITWRPNDAFAARAACRRWLRPASLDTLMPVAVAAMPFDDQLVYAGGTLEQCRAEAQWTPGERTFASLHAQRSKVRNLVSPLDGVLNTSQDITNLDRLRNRAISQEPKPDELEDQPVYGEGIARRVGVALEHIAGRHVALRAHYTYTSSENTADKFSKLWIPYLPRHQVNLGLTWTPGWHSYIRLSGIYRSSRFTDEANTAPLPAGWDANVTFYVESADKHWALEASALNLVKKEASDVFGVLVSYRF